jgi:hypothetical protein
MSDTETMTKSPAVHAYAKGAGAGDAVSVKAPVITQSKEGAAPLLDFAARIAAHTNTEIAQAEAERLRPYFSALSVYLTEETGKSATGLPESYVTPGALSGMFNAMARFTRNTFISDVVIAPHSVKWLDPSAHLFNSATFDHAFAYGAHSFRFGFFEVFEGRGREAARSSTVVPVLTLEDSMMQAVAPHAPGKMLRALQAVLTAVNHDMLHHLHSTQISRNIAHKFGEAVSSPDLSRWNNTLQGGGMLEVWSQLAHGQVYMAEGNEALMQGLEEAAAGFYAELARIGKALPEKEAHDVVDYFGTALMQALTRAFPLDHPLMSRCLDGLVAADPLAPPQKTDAAIDTLLATVAPHLHKGGVKQDPVSVVRSFIEGDPDLGQAVAGYRKRGLELLPGDNLRVEWKGVKLLQLAQMSPADALTHLPASPDRDVAAMQEQTGSAALGLVRAVVKTTGYKPK